MTAVCTGLPVLLNLCASGIINRGSNIIYLKLFDPQNDSPEENTFFQKHDEFCLRIANFFSYEISIIPMSAKFYPAPRSKKIHCIFDKPRISLERRNLISANALRFFPDELKGKSVDVFPEGVSCFLPLRDRSGLGKIFSTRLGTIFREYYTAKFNDPFDRNIHWLLPDREGQIEEKIGIRRRFKVIPTEPFYKRIFECSKYFSEIYPEINYSNLINPVFHPVFENLNKTEYNSYLDKQKSILKKSNLLVKPKPRDRTDYHEYFEGYSVKIPPDVFRILPAELLFGLENMQYVGHYSTTILSFPKDKIEIIEPESEHLSLRYKFCNSGLRSMLAI